MHAITESVRTQYERFPYPDGPPVLRQASDARLLLSYSARSRGGGGPIHVLDAGCGRGVGLIGCAVSQPDVSFVGVDLCRASLAAARDEAEQRGLDNVRFQELDLMTLEGLEVPEGGFDVILSSGVLHHLAEPAEGLRRLEAVLAPHGVLSLMVYGRHGREALYRLVRAIDALVPRDRPLEERLAVGRDLVRESLSEALLAGPWSDLRAIADAEFVDRYLNVNETSYDVPGLLDLIDAGGLRFLRWSEPADWAVEVLIPPGPTRERALALEPAGRWQLVDELFWRPSLEVLLCKQDNGPRAALGAAAAHETLALSPEVKLQVERRNLRGAQRTERLRLQVRSREPIEVPPGPAVQALAALEGQTTSFEVVELAQVFRQAGVTTADAMRTIEDLIALEVLYRPHAVDA